MVDKAEERKFADLAVTRFGWDLDSIQPREPPDFRLVFRDGSMVGLEVARTINGALTAGRKAYKRLGDKVSACLKIGGFQGSVTLSSVGSLPELLADPDAFKAHVSAITAAILERSKKGSSSFAISARDLQKMGAPWVTSVRVRKGAGVEVIRGHNGRGPNIPFLDALIRRKDKKIPSYREKLPGATAFWLLLVSGSQHDWFPDKLVENTVYRTKFDRVFFLDTVEDVAIELRICRRPDDE
jgi:hypothetical protein